MINDLQEDVRLTNELFTAQITFGTSARYQLPYNLYWNLNIINSPKDEFSKVKLCLLLNFTNFAMVACTIEFHNHHSEPSC